MGRKRRDTGWYSPTRYPTDNSVLYEPAGIVPSSAVPVIFVGHGRGGGAEQAIRAPLEPYCRGLVEAGFPVFGLDHARVNSWGDPDSIEAIVDADAKVRALGYTRTAHAGIGQSMGDLTLTNYATRYPSKIKCLWGFNGAMDPLFWNDTAYSPSYAQGTASGSKAIWGATGTNEIPVTYQPTSAVVGTTTIPISTDPTGVTLNITAGTGKSFADGLTFGGAVALPRATVPTGTFTYTGKTDNTLTGCKSIGAAFSAAGAAAITTAWATQIPGYNAWSLAAYFGTLGVKKRMVQASDDTIVPPAMNANDATGYVGRAASANVTLRSPSPTGGHSLSIVDAQIPVSEVVAWFLANAF